ncbi:titin-like protein [Lates japonicus]|uniref:Titin-like protein n=1 Tax=Lates japonicus TaxID=270547 RepID=A0AAD3MQP1_LATJO|nr:titin-like protein [Lates japonicus]
MEVTIETSARTRINETCDEMGELLAELYNNGKGKDAERNAEKLRAALRMETNSRKEAERNLARQEEETSTIKQTLAQVKNDLENSRCQWENERSRLLADQSQEVSTLEASFRQELEKKTSEWEEDRSRLMEEQVKVTSTLKETFLQELEKERSEWERERSRLLEEQMRETSNLSAALVKARPAKGSSVAPSLASWSLWCP